MKTYDFEFTTKINFSLPVINHNFVLKCLPHNSFCQMIYDEKLVIEPEAKYTIGTDSYGNKTINGTILSEHNDFVFSVKGKACLGKYKVMEELNRVYLYPSPSTSLSESMKDFFNSLSIPEDTTNAVKYISEAVHNYMTYTKGVTDINTGAATAFDLKQGVCQDYAQITIALLRENKIPARYAAGFIEGDGETHAWVEYYVNGSWYAIDPTNNNMVDYGYIKLSHGLDSSSCSVERGCFASKEGIVNQTTDILVKVGEIK